jgi:hypothetical protein
LPGQALVMLNLSPQNLSQYHRIIRFNHSELWSQFRPWWQNWYVLAPAGAAAGATGAYFLIKKDGNKGTVNGDVFVRFPF